MMKSPAAAGLFLWPEPRLGDCDFGNRAVLGDVIADQLGVAEQDEHQRVYTSPMTVLITSLSAAPIAPP